MTTGPIRILVTSIACMFFACLVDSASAQPQASRPSYTFCLSHPTPPDTSYFSGIFVVDPSIDGDALAWNAESQRIAASGHGATSPAPWVGQFDQFITKTYPRTRKGAGSCNGFATLAEAQKRLDEVIQSEQNFKYKVVETGWKYTTAHAIAPPVPANQPAAANVASTPVAPAQPITPARANATPAAAVAHAETPYAVCWGEVTGNNPAAYFGVPFDGTAKDTAAWTKSYREALNSKYGRASAGPLHCNTLKSLADAQTYLQTTMDNLRTTHKIIETGWKYQ